VALTVNEPPKGTTRLSHVWTLDLRSRQMRQFTNSEKSETSPRWSLDGKQLAFLSDRGEFRQIYRIPLDGGEAQPLTKGKQNIESFEWSGDGRKIAFIAPEAKTDAEEQREKDKDDAHAVDREDKRPQLWVLDVASGQLNEITPGTWRVSEVHWLPNGAQVVISGTDHPEVEEYTNRIFVVNLADKKMTELAAPHGPFRTLRVSPDGRTIAYVATPSGPAPQDLYIVPTSGGQSRNLTRTSLDRPILSLEWRSDRELAAVVRGGFKTMLVSIALDGSVKRDGELPVNPGAFAVSPSGVLVFAGQTATEPEEVWLRQANGTIGCISKLNESWAEFRLAKPEYFRYKSFDGIEIEASLLPPLDNPNRTHWATIALIHGGPTGAWSDSIEPWGQLLAANGYAIFYANIRGSVGYGEKFTEINRGDWGGGDFRDVMAGLDDLVARGIADPDRLGIGGWSYGGYMAEWAITQTQRFKAAVSGAGMANLASEFGTETGPEGDEWFYKTPHENLDGFMNSSPVKYLRNAHTPTLILQGDADTVDPLGQSEELYRGLKRYGVTAELVVYPREPHGFREEKHQIDRLNRIVAWFQQYLPADSEKTQGGRE
jgi:dipeptidyl aminopeptidase/acylaminoacyl peptidase